MTRRPSDREETRSSSRSDIRSQYRSIRDSCTTSGPCPSRNDKESLFDAVDYLDALERTRRKSRSVGGANVKRPRLPIIDYNSPFRGNEYIRNGKINTLVFKSVRVAFCRSCGISLERSRSGGLMRPDVTVVVNPCFRNSRNDSFRDSHGYQRFPYKSAVVR